MATSYLTAVDPNISFEVIATVGDKVDTKTDGVTPYRMVGIPDGLGAFDNGDGTITVLMNHEVVGLVKNLSGGVVNNPDGIVRAHGAAGSFVSEWILDKTDLSIVSVGDAIQTVRLWDRFDSDSDGDANVDWLSGSAFSISRLCSADLAPVSAYYWVDTMGTETTTDDVAYGTQERIFLTGEEFSPVRDNPATPAVNEEVLGGREFAYVATGADKGVAFELAHFGYFAWENAISSPFAQKKTINISMDDGLNGQVYVYVGEKQTTGNAVEMAGLTGGTMYGIRVTGLVDGTLGGITNGNETDAVAASGRFDLYDEGDISLLTGIQLDDQGEANGVTSFLRPEDGQFDPTNPNVFYFLTTASISGQSRLYKLTFDDITNPETGGTIEAVLSSSDIPTNSAVGPRMMDNMTVTPDGKVIIQEDVGNNAHIGRILEYDPVSDTVTVLAQHDASRFVNGGANFLTQDEESSGIIDITQLLDYEAGSVYLNVTQAHKNLRVSDPELVEDGQFQAIFDATPTNGTKAAEGVDGDGGNNTLSGLGGNDVMRGFAGNDELLGGAGDDTLFGGSGKDTLKGGAGGDTLNGGAGADILNGGLGGDTFVFSFGDSTNATLDQVTDFSSVQGDKIDLQALDISAADLVISSTGGRGYLVSIDIDGDGGFDFALAVVSRNELGISDFLL
ncbi:MAG: hypothetical protein B7Z08_09160 [Sphingomonadales bacterium 32-68-7]|nr:MAG: hypothetical protein B7Z33_11800 [Sphingomonadales bacterium 12-68-11]OYX08466.1 MAG: hypothetical protein B7Z08_09160 [Sphingomonadales bacterium 32-68-7]